MDHKTWLWRKKSAEKTIVSTDKVHLSMKGNEEIHTLLTDKEELEKEVKNLTDELSSAFSGCNAKDDLMKRHAKIAQNATEGWEKAELVAKSIKKELTEALQQRVAGEEKSTNVDAALNECMQQLQYVRDEQEQRIHDAVMKTSREFEKSQMALKEKLAETSKRLAKVGVEKTHLSEALLVKEKLIEELNKQRTQMEAGFYALMTRLENIEEENGSLNYELRVLEKELEIRNEEREFNRRTADASHRLHLENVKKITKLESECQRLRLLVRKRLPGPAAFAKMKHEVEILGRDSAEIRRKKLNAGPNGFTFDSSLENSPDTARKRIHFLNKKLYSMEEENKNLKEALNSKTNELRLSSIMYAGIPSNSSQVDSRLEESSKGQAIREPTISNLMSRDLSLASMSYIGSDDKISCAESWASSLISEFEHFTDKKHKGSPPVITVGASDINLMDDFVEMEKLALVSIDKPSVSFHSSSVESTAILGPTEIQLSDSSGVLDKKIIPFSDFQPDFSVLNPEIEASKRLTGKVPDWLQDVLKVISEQTHVSHRTLDEILKDIRVGLAYINHPIPGDFVDASKSSNHPDASYSLHVSNHISWKPSNKSLFMDLSNRVNDVDLSSTEKSNEQFQSDLRKSIYKIIDLIDGISLPVLEDDKPEALTRKEGGLFSYKNETPTGYMVRVFHWKITELSAVLQQFVYACYDLLNGKPDLNKFCHELTSALEWIINHCFSFQDVSSMRDAIKKQFGWDELQSEAEAEVGLIGQFSDADRLRNFREQLSKFPSTSASDGQNTFSQMEDLQPNVREENKNLDRKLINIESAEKDLERRLQSATENNEFLVNQLQESERTIMNLQTEIQILTESKGAIGNQIENHKLMSEDLHAQLRVARIELNEARHKFSSLEMELENKSICCEELESSYLELQLHLESLIKKDIPTSNFNQEEEHLRTDMEIAAASEKLAECQETILNLGKQLKALATPPEESLFDKIICIPIDTNTTDATTTTMAKAPAPPKSKNMKHRSSLRDRMLADDVALAKDAEDPVIKEIKGHSIFDNNGAVKPQQTKHNVGDDTVNSLAILPSKKRGGQYAWAKLLWRKKRSKPKKTAIQFSP